MYIAIFGVLLLSQVLSQTTYCSSGPTTTVDTTLGNVTLVGGNGTVISDSHACPNSIGVQDYTNQVVDIFPQSTYTLAYTVTTCGSQYSTASSAWIDYNQNGIFESSEQLFSVSHVFGRQSHNFVVPSSALIGKTRLRVQVQESSADSMNPCAMFPYGGTKDFSVNVMSAKPSYCSSGPTTTVDGNLGLVSFIGDTQSFNETSNCPGKVGPQDFTNLIADVTLGMDYKLTYSVTTCGSTFPTKSGAWVDWNQNDIFDSNEILFPFSTKSGIQTYSFFVPASALVGTTRMRVQVQETSSSNPLDPCSLFPYGGTKDFSIKVKVASSYCASGPTTTVDGNLGPVSLIGDTQSINETSNCPGKIGAQDFTNLVADVTVGYPYKLSYNVTTCGNAFPTKSEAWVDWNQNQIFDSNEILFPVSSQQGGQSYTFTVPTNALVGTTRMRVQVQETSSTNPLNPCTMFAYGGTKDFSIAVKIKTEF